MKIAGTKDVVSGQEYQYTVTFDGALESDKKLLISVDASVAFFSTDRKNWKTFVEVICPKGSKTTTFIGFWIKEYSKTYLRVKDISGGLDLVTLEIKVTVEKCTLTMTPKEIVLGKDCACVCKYPYNTDSKIHTLWADWDSYDAFFKRIGNESIGEKQCSIPLKPIKTGKSKIGVHIEMLDNTKGIRFSFCKGELDVKIMSPYSLSMNSPVAFACLGSTLSYRINGLLNDPSVKEVINWHCSNNGQMVSANGGSSASFKIISEGSIFTVGATITTSGQSFELNADNKVWIGKPTVKPNIDRERTMDAGTELTLDIDDFSHYLDDITYTVESGIIDKVTMETLSANSFKIISKHPRLLADILKIRFTASNPCGTISCVYTIHVEAGPGSGFDKPLNIFSLSDQRISFYERYSIDEMAGDLRNFKLYFSFEFLRKADCYPLRAVIGQTDMIFKAYNAERKETNLFVPSGEEPYSVTEVPAGLYYGVVDAYRIDKETELQVAVYAMVKGNYLHYPYIIDVKESDWEFHDSRDTTSYYQEFYYLDEQGQEVRTTGENNVYYIMKLDKQTPLLIHAAGSKATTEIHIMQGEPFIWKVLYHVKGSSLSWNSLQKDPDIPQNVKDSLYDGQTCFKRLFQPGEYRFVLNATKMTNGGVHNGIVNINILPYSVKGTSLANAYELGTFSDREFSEEQLLPDIRIHRELGLEYIYFHFAFKKNVGLSVKAEQSAMGYFPIELYDTNHAKVIESTGGACILPDVTNTEFFVGVKIREGTDDNFILNLEGSFRGNSPFGHSYIIGTYDADFFFEDSVDTSVSRSYELFRYNDGATGNYYPIITPEANHVYYTITLLKPMEMIIEMPGSYGYVEYHVMVGEPYGWSLFAKGTTYETRKHTVKMSAGEYKLVFNFIKLSNGSPWNGLINLKLTGKVVSE